MSVLKFINKNKWLIPLIGFLLAYFPLISSVMSIKNDSCVLSYPIFYFFSSQLHNGIIPFWHYNMHLGFSLYADPGTAFFNPFFWLFALVGNSISVYVWYILLHVLFAAYGMYLLAKQLGFEHRTRTILSVAYIAGGYFVAHLQHSNAIIESAYLPFVINYLYALFKTPTFKNSIFLGLFFYLFTVSGYPGFAIGMPYFIAMLGIGYLITSYGKNIFRKNIKPALLFVVSIVIAVLLCLPFLYGIYSNFENFQRGTTFSGNTYLFEGGASPALGFMSFILPLTSVVKSTPFPSSDMAWNNMYLGLIPFLFFIAALKFKNLKTLLPHLIVVAFFLDISFEGQIKQLFFKLPLLNFLRYNGGLRIYAMLSLLIIAGTVLNDYFTTEKYDTTRLKNIIKYFLIIILVTLVSAVIYGIFNNEFTRNTNENIVKQILNIGFFPALLLQSFYVFIVLLLAKKWLHNKRKLWLLAIADIVLCFWVNLPFSGLSIQSMPAITKDIEASTNYVNSFTHNNIITEKEQNPAVNHVVFAPALMSKKVGTIPLHAYPSGKKSYFDFIAQNGFDYFNNKPFCYLFSAQQQALPYTINAATIEINCSTLQDDTLFIHQNFDKNWKAYTAEKPLQISLWQNTFMKITLPPHTKNVSLVFKDSIENKLMFLPLIGCCVIAIYLFINFIKRKKE